MMQNKQKAGLDSHDRNIDVISHILKGVSVSLTGKETILGFTDRQLETLRDYYHAFLAGEFSNIKSYATICTQFEIIKKHTVFLNNHRNNKHYLDVTSADLKENFAMLKERGMKESSLSTYKIYLKMFYRWLGKDNVIDWIKVSRVKRYLEENKLITEEDLSKLLKVCGRLRDRCMIIMLYEGCFRASELTNININDVIIDENCANVSVSGKTGKRSIILIDSVPYLQNYINNHPFKDNPNHCLFYSEQNGSYGQKIAHGSLSGIIRTITKKAELNKKIYPHLFRHSGLNMLAKKGFNERDLRIYAGWSSTSDMPDVYLHYGEKEVGNKILKMKGIVKDEKKEIKDLLKPKKCPRCEKLNPSDSKYCNCGMALDIKQVIKDTEKREKIDDELNKMFEDQEFKEIVRKYLRKKQKLEV